MSGENDNQKSGTYEKYGCIGIITEIFKWLFKAIKCILFGKEGFEAILRKIGEKTSLKNDRSNEKNKIFQKWEAVWCNRNGLNDSQSIETHFYNLFVENYQYVSLKREKNKKRNFLWKSIFIIVLLVTLVGWALLFYYCYVQKEMGLIQTIISSGGVFAFITLVCGIVSKWLDIKKYQATWIRHTYLLQQLNYEMLLYSYGLKYYSQFDRETEFILRILKLWNTNVDRFTEDMVKNEGELMDLFHKQQLMNADK